MVAWYGTPSPMNFRLRHVADPPVPEATDFSEAVFDELQKRVSKRVRDAVDGIVLPVNPRRRTDWASLKTIEDWKAFHAARPEWKGLSTSAMQKEAESGGYAFYQAFRIWCKKEAAGDEAKRQELIGAIFPKMLSSWESFLTLGEWTAYYAARPEFHGVLAGEMKSVPGGNAFYGAFLRWCNSEAAGDEAKKKALVETIFRNEQRSWTGFASIADWMEFYEAHPEWKGLNSSTISSVKGGLAFYGAFSRWCKSEAAGDATRRRELMETLIPPGHNPWKRFSTIGEWAVFFASRPEWQGMSTGELRAAKGGNAFYVAFKAWCRKRSDGDERARREMMSEVLVPRYRSWDRFACLADWIGYFSTKPEWHGLSTEEIALVGHGGAFYQAFLKWCKAESAGDEAKRRALMRSIFPPRGKNRWRFED